LLKKFIWFLLTFYDEKKVDSNSKGDKKEDHRHKKCFVNNTINQKLKIWYDLWHRFVWNRNINHLKILAMSCSCDHAFFLQRKSDKHFTIRYREAFSGPWECFFMRKYVSHNVFWVFSSTDWSRIHILLKSWKILLLHRT
jgi:hypothetical protein